MRETFPGKSHRWILDNTMITDVLGEWVRISNENTKEGPNEDEQENNKGTESSS